MKRLAALTLASTLVISAAADQALACDYYAIFIGEKHDCGITKSFTQSYR